MSALVSGSGPEHVVCLHGLGSNKTSFFETISALTPELTVHAIDLPGFGSSAKPVRAPYDARYFARAVGAYLDAAGIERAHLVGNSMGGRAALEIGLSEPERVASLSLLSPALAFRRRRALVPLVKLVRPELAAIPHGMRAKLVRRQLWTMFAFPDRLDPATVDVVTDEFCRTYRSRAARIAFYAAARNIYLDPPWGDRGFWARLAALEPPALFVWGDCDRLVPPAFARHVRAALPAADQVVLRDCGHVPQVELPSEANQLARAHIEAASRPLDAARAAARGLARSA
jgi:pimeloyl-ACP methyl ester carboxylesterase